LGALCHGSQVFLRAKLTKGRKATGYWPIMEDMANAGATVLDQPVVVDENVITSRFIYDIPQFVDAIVAQLI
jgi:protease I